MKCNQREIIKNTAPTSPSSKKYRSPYLDNLGDSVTLLRFRIHLFDTQLQRAIHEKMFKRPLNILLFEILNLTQA